MIAMRPLTAVLSAAAIAIAAAAATAHAATCNSLNTGNWNTGGNWSCGASPGAGDDVTINNGHNINLNGNNRNALSLTVNAGGTLTTGSNNITIAAGTGVLTVSGTIQGNGNAASRVIKNSTGDLAGTGTFNNLNDVTITADTTIAATANLTFAGAECRLDVTANDDVINNGTLTFSGAACGTSKVINLANPATFTNNGTVTAGSIVGASAANSVWTNAANSTLTVTAALLATGTLNASANANTVHYNVNAAQTVKLPSGGDYYHLTLSTGGTKTPSAGTYDVLGNLTINAGVTFNANTNDPTLNVTGNMTVAGTYSSSNSAALRVDGILAISGTYTGNGGALNLSGNFTQSGTFTSGTGIVTFTGSNAQTLGGANATTITSLTVNKASNHVTVACGTPSPTVNTTLVLTSGRIITSGSSPACSAACSAQVPVIVAAAGTITGGSSSSYVQGALRKLFAAAATLNFRAVAGQDEFPVGDASNYSPIEITAGTTSTAGNVTVCVTATEHPQVTTPPVPTGGIDAGRSVNRYWSMATSTINTTAVPVDATFKFVAGDKDGPANTANFIVEDWNGVAWFPTTLAAAGATSTRAQNIDITGATNEFAIGEPISGFTAVPGRYNVFETATPASILGMIQTKAAGIGFTLDVVHVNATKTGVLAGAITVEVRLLDSSGGGALDVNGCNAAWPLIQAQPNFAIPASGRGTLPAVTVNNSFRDVRFQIRSPVGGPYTQIGCSTDRFSIRPQSLTISALDANWETAGTARALNNIGATGGNVHKASEISATTPRPFTLRATPVPASATNYDGSPTTVSGFPTCGALCTTAGGLNFTAGSWTSAGGGVRDNATANYSEAGTFNLQLEDSTYASVDAVDGTPAATRTVPSTGTVQIGRFVPERFEFTSPGTPTLLTFNDGICSSRSFTYIGQPFWYVAGGRPAATLNAVNAAGTVTSNYTLDVASSKPAISEIYADGTAPAAAPLVTTSIGTPTVTSGSGTGTYLASLSGQLSYSRSTTTPVGLFNSAISLTVTASDATDSAASGNGTINTPSSLVFNGGGSGIAFDSGAQFRYGRLRIGNANGSQLVPLLVRLETQYWSGPPSNAFITNAADSCTTLAGTNITMGNFQGNLGPLASCKTNINANVTFAAGRGNLQLTAPGSGNGGSVDLTVQLGSGAFGSNSCVSPGSPPPQATIGANRAYLQGNWTGGLFTQDPTGRASFGQFKGAEEVIYIRENF